MKSFAERVADAINQNYVEAFGFPPGFVKASVNKDGALKGELNIHIGGRDIHVHPGMERVDSGSDVPRRWDIADKREVATVK